MVSLEETISLTDLRIFMEAAKALSITRAGEALDLPKSAVSKTITRLEERLGVRLLERTSRRVALTAAGRLLMVKAESLLAEAEFLTRSLREERNDPRGTVRMTAPPELGTRFVERVVPKIVEAYPGLKIALKLAYDFDDLREPAIDIALRAGQVHDDRLVASPIGKFARVLVASAGYLENNRLRRPADLANLDCLVFSAEENSVEWELVRGDRSETFRVTGNLAVRSFAAQLHAARAGLGVARCPAFAAAEWIERGDLVHVLPGWQAPPVTVFAVHRFGHERIARVAAVLAATRSVDWL
jgi:DNA-binding transcriptional LysR family regulator